MASARMHSLHFLRAKSTENMSFGNLCALSVLVVLLVSIGITYFQNPQLHSKEELGPNNYLTIPVRKDGVIFVSDGAKGSIREASIELAKHGYHVLVGCKSDAEIRSFAFDSRKGLELIKFDIANPATFVTLVYRLRQIRRDLDRPLVGIVLNLADYIEDYNSEATTDYLNIIYLDRYYKALFKGPVRLLQSLFELLKHYHTESVTANSLQIAENASVPLDYAVVDTGALRVTTLYGEYAAPRGVPANSVEYIRLCGTKCDVQAAFLNYLDGFVIANTQYSNFTLSNVRVSLQQAPAQAAPTQTAQSNAKQQQQPSTAAIDLVSPRGEKAYDERVLAWRLKRVEAYTHSRIQWALGDKNQRGNRGGGDKDQDLEGDLDMQDSESHRESLRKMSVETKAIVHSFLSNHPLKVYA